jgi:hypothetical protein
VEVRHDRDVAEIEQPVQIRPEQDPVPHVVSAAEGVWLDVRGLENGKRVLACDGTGAAGRRR